MKALLVGFGSIGKRHFNILKSMNVFVQVDLVTRQNIKGEKCFLSLQSVTNIAEYDYFIIASETSAHYEQLNFLCSRVSKKKILVEKPLFDGKREPFNMDLNQVYVGYNLRFHPVLERLKQLLEGQEVYYSNIMCGQYLPTWRPSQDYQKSYSADVKRGGGVLRDLSHELDYTQWLFGSFERMHAISLKRSDLIIRSDDIFTAVGLTSKKVVVNITLDYISKRPIRRLVVHTKNITIEADVIESKVLVSNKEGEVIQEKVGSVDRDYTYSQMHKAIINNKTSNLCGYDKGLELVSLIDGVEFEESS